MRSISRFVRNAWQRHEIGLTMAFLVFLLLVVFFWPRMVVSIDVGERGVLWSRFFGTDTSHIYDEGLHVIAPWNTLAIYNVRYQGIDQTFEALSKEGLTIEVATTIRFRPAARLIGRLHQDVGPDYVKTVVIPEVGNALREVISEYAPEALYTNSLSTIDDEIVNRAREQVRERFVNLDDVNIRAIVLPPIVADAIQRKIEEKQAVQEMEYRVQREKLEADRKRAEAAGIHDFQTIVAPGLTEQYLRYRGIEATLELAKSTNAKIIVVGNNAAGLPVLLNADTLSGTPSVVLPKPPAPAPK